MARLTLIRLVACWSPCPGDNRRSLVLLCRTPDLISECSKNRRRRDCALAYVTTSHPEPLPIRIASGDMLIGFGSNGA